MTFYLHRRHLGMTTWIFTLCSVYIDLGTNFIVLVIQKIECPFNPKMKQPSHTHDWFVVEDLQ